MSLAARFSPVLVTGASGFVGACAVRRLLAEGYRVHVLLCKEARTWRIDEVLDRMVVHRADVQDDAGVAEAFRACRPRAVLHLAAHGAYESQDDSRQILDTTVLGSLNVIEGAHAAGAVLVSAGSSSEYGFRSEPMAEGDRLEPNSVYAVGKAAQTHLVRLLAQRPQAPGMVTFRLFSVYGPWEEPGRLFPVLLRRARAGLPLEMVAPTIARDFVYVDDVLDALLAFDHVEALHGDVLNLGSGVQSTLADVVAAVQEAVGTRSEVRWGGMAPRRWDAHHWQCDPSRTQALLGWTARTTLREGVVRMARWMETREDAYAGR